MYIAAADPFSRYPAASRRSCANACGGVAGCTGYLWDQAEEKCDLALGKLEVEANVPGPINGGRLTEFCGQKFAKDAVQVKVVNLSFVILMISWR